MAIYTGVIFTAVYTHLYGSQRGLSQPDEI
jgi:hypothetical protein